MSQGREGAIEGGEGKLRIFLLGPFQIISPDGRDLTPMRQKANALLALVAVAERGQRARSWLCSRLWSDRSQDQALGSLRQSLTDLRRALGAEWERYIHIDAFNVAIDFSNVWIDAVALREQGPIGLETECGEFLEGIDVRDDEFEDWLAIERSYWRQLRDDRRVRDTAPVADVRLPVDVAALAGQGTISFTFGKHVIEIRVVDAPILSDAVAA